VKAAKVIGRVMASRKYETLEGARLLLIQPVSWEKEPEGDPIVAVDTVGAGASEFVFWVAAREAAIAMGGDSMKDTPPVDAAVVGILDGVNLQGWTKNLSPRVSG
jgi:ethanolamine utilization protein EutN